MSAIGAQRPCRHARSASAPCTCWALGELQRDFWLRPDNIEADIAAIRARLHALGLEAQAVVCGCTSLDAATEAAVDALWDGAALNQGYRATQERLQRWLDGAARPPIDQAARESFFLGGAAIRQLVYDPLLPEPMVDGRCARLHRQRARLRRGGPRHLGPLLRHPFHPDTPPPARPACAWPDALSHRRPCHERPP